VSVSEELHKCRRPLTGGAGVPSPPQVDSQSSDRHGMIGEETCIHQYRNFELDSLPVKLSQVNTGVIVVSLTGSTPVISHAVVFCTDAGAESNGGGGG